MNPIAKLATTRASLRHIEIALKLAEFTSTEIAAAVRQWRRAHAAQYPLRLRDVWDDVAKRRLAGLAGAPELEVTFDVRSGSLTRASRDGAPIVFGSTRSSDLSAQTLRDELDVINSQVFDEEKGITLNPRWKTLLARAVAGDPNALSFLGIARVDRPGFPLAFRKSATSLDVSTMLLTRVECVQLPPVPQGFDGLAEVDRLARSGHLPLASREDQRRFLMALASPLLRDELPGLLGVYWIYGPPGSGKEFIATALKHAWGVCGRSGARPSVELRDPSFSEDRKSLATAPDAVYAHLREAVKWGPSMIEAFIRLTGQATLSLRGLYRDEVERPNTLTFVCDSAEPPPARREIQRRSVVINTAPVSGGLSVHAMREFQRVAPALLSWCLQLVERLGRDLLDTSSPDGRPIAQEVLAQAFGAELDAVGGEDLGAVFEAMAEYVRIAPASDVVKPSRNAPKLASEHRVYRTAAFLERMAEEPGFKALIGGIRKNEALLARISVEAPEYQHDVDRAGCHVVECGGHRYGFRFVGPRAGQFVFFPIREPAPELADLLGGAK